MREMRNVAGIVMALMLVLMPQSLRGQLQLDNQTRIAIGQMQQALLWTDYFYVDTVNVNKLAEDAVRGMLKELDPHSDFLNAEETKALNEDLGGNFEGIGVMYQMVEDTLLVINTVIGGPSEKMGILAGDQIVWVNDTTIAGMKLNTKELQKRLRGPKGSHVKISVLRYGERIDFDIERDKIPVNSVDASYMIDEGVGYIKVSRFAASTPQEFSDALEVLKKQGMKHLVIDLQGNGGGYLQSAVLMASHFLKRNNLIVYTEGRTVGRQDNRTNKDGDFDGRVVVLIDEGSASSSEIFAGALQDYDRAVVVGRRSFGKGLVQRPIELPGDCMIKLTVAHYYTPSGRCIQKPYTKGDRNSYRKDLKERYDKGEFLSADSIHFADSLKYETKGGRIVYGGGGIMPDVFVPIDTTQICKTHRDLIARGSLNRYILEYFRLHQKEMHKRYETFESFDREFTVSDKMVDDLCKRGAEHDSIRIDTTELNANRDMLKLQMKAYLANDMYKEGTYNRVMNQKVPAFVKAKAIITDEKEYLRLLQQPEQEK